MPLTPEQLDHRFNYHAPTEETRPKYAAIRAAEFECHQLAANIRLAGNDVDTGAYAVVNSTLRAFAEAINDNAPDCADKTAALRCVGLARNCLNEQVASVTQGFPVYIDLVAEAHRQIVLARFQANSAVALDGK